MLTHGCAEAGAAPSHKKQAASCTSPWVTNTMTLLHSSLYSNYQKCCTCNAQPVLSLPRSAWRRNSNFALTRRRLPAPTGTRILQGRPCSSPHCTAQKVRRHRACWAMLGTGVQVTPCVCQLRSQTLVHPLYRVSRSSDLSLYDG